MKFRRGNWDGWISGRVQSGIRQDAGMKKVGVGRESGRLSFGDAQGEGKTGKVGKSEKSERETVEKSERGRG